MFEIITEILGSFFELFFSRDKKSSKDSENNS